jgi:hypothetical protein
MVLRRRLRKPDVSRVPGELAVLERPRNKSLGTNGGLRDCPIGVPKKVIFGNPYRLTLQAARRTLSD